MKNHVHPSLRQSLIFCAPLSFARRASLFLMALLLASAAAHGQPQPSQKTMLLSRIEVSGLRSTTKEQVIAISGLQEGSRISIEALDAAAQKLSNSGLFTNLSYRLRGTSEAAIVTFELEELKARGVPVVFDNFVWFTDEELASAIRRELPTFNGTAPESDSMIALITKALQRLLDERKITGQVDYTPSANLSGGNVKHVFSVKGTNTKICAITFPGRANVQESELVKQAKPLMGSEYSKEFVSAFAVANLIPVYRERGHLRASFSNPSAKLGGDGNCKDQILITLPVDEGMAYNWDKAEWSGNDSATPEVLESALAMKAGELANGLKIDAGIRALQKSYGKKGFLRARATTEPIFDDANRRVAYHINITEGPQFRMGTLKITGLPPDDALRLRHRWQLREKKDIYDDTYLDGFIKKEASDVVNSALREGRIPAGARLKMETPVKPNEQTLTVDVEINFKTATPETATP